jgi:hypothetical protein
MEQTTTNSVNHDTPIGQGAWDTIGGYYVGTADWLVGPSDLSGKSEDFKKAYNAINTEPRHQLAKDIARNPASANIAAGTLGLMSGFVPGAPDGSDLPVSMQETYRMFSFASKNATAIVQGVEGMRSVPPRAQPPHLAPTGAPSSGMALAAPAVQSIPAASVLNVTMAAGARKGSGGTRKDDGSPPDNKPKRGYEPGDRHPQTGRPVLGKLEKPDRVSATVEPGNPKLDEQILGAKPSTKLNPPPTVTLESTGAHDPASTDYKSGKSVMPSAQKQVELFNKSVATSPNGQTIPARGAMDEAGRIHQFHASGENNYHWAGQEGGVSKTGEPVNFDRGTAAYFKAILYFLKNM